MNPGPPPYHPPGPPKGRNRGCLYGVIGGIAALLLLASCGAIAASRNTTAPAAAPSPSHTDNEPKKVTDRSRTTATGGLTWASHQTQGLPLHRAFSPSPAGGMTGVTA